MMIKAILFDMDGVLVDAKDWHYEALNKALGIFGMGISRYDHLHTFDGLPTRVKLRMLSEQHNLPEELHTFINQLKQKYTIEITQQMCKPIFHHEYALSKLQKDGYRIAVCSNSIKHTIEMMMRRAELIQYIDLIVSNEDVVNAKPDPEMYCYAIKKFSINPQECIVVEDNPKGIAAGIASGAHVLPVATVNDVNYDNIINMVKKCEAEHD